MNRIVALVVILALSACSKPAEPAPAAPAPVPSAPAIEPPAVGQSEKEKALANPYPNDLGPDRLPDSVLAGYDSERRKGYALLLVKCAKCHTSSRSRACSSCV